MRYRDINEMINEVVSEYEKKTGKKADAESALVYSFPQTWASTALGFGGIGGQAFTSAQTTAIMVYGEDELCGAVFFGGGLAYLYPSINCRFEQDIANCKMSAVLGSAKYACRDGDYWCKNTTQRKE